MQHLILNISHIRYIYRGSIRLFIFGLTYKVCDIGQNGTSKYIINERWSKKRRPIYYFTISYALINR